MERAGQQTEKRPAIQSSDHWALQHQTISNYWLIPAFLCLPYLSHRVSCPDINRRERVPWASVTGECLTLQCLLCDLKWHKKLKFKVRLQDCCPEKKFTILYRNVRTDVTCRWFEMLKIRTGAEMTAECWLSSHYIMKPNFPADLVLRRELMTSTLLVTGSRERLGIRIFV